jgi:hypothetical protein
MRAKTLTAAVGVVTLTSIAALAPACGRADAPAEVPGEAIELVDLAGRPVDPFAASGLTADVFVFVRTDCPVSNRYAPELRRLAEEFGPRGVRFVLVYPNPDATAEAIRAHLQEYGLQMTALRDPEHRLVERTEVTITPEAVVFTPAGELVYRGRIDNRYVDFGKTRARASEHDLQRAIEAVLEGRSVATPRTQAVGCFIADLT